MTPSLPQFDPEPDARALCVARERTRFQLSWDREGLPGIRSVPLSEQVTPPYLAQAARWEVGSFATIGRSGVEAAYVDPDGGARAWWKRAREELRTAIVQRFTGPHRDVRVPSWSERGPLSLADYEAILPLDDKPRSLRHWRHDWWFAYQRLAGCDPVLLTRVTGEIPPLVNPDPAIYATLFPGDTPARALEEGRLFLVDYAMLAGISTSVSPDGYRKFLCAPVALFALPPDRRWLMPVCIRCEQRATDDVPLVYPTDDVAWKMARTVVQVADSNYHGVVEHGVHCHIMAGAIAVCLYRNLAPSHPIRVLLHPHFEFTLPIQQATLGLFAPGGRTPVIQSPDVDGTLKLARWAYESHRWNEQAPPRQFERRGVLDRAVLPDYPFRDDALDEWEIILRFVGRYLSLYYNDDQDVRDDVEVQAWAHALRSPTGAALRDFGDGDQLASFAALVDFVAQLIYRVTTYHNVINYGVWDAMGFMPNMPMAQYAPAPRSRSGYSPDDLMSMMPPREMAWRQFNDVYLVGHLRVNRLGEYPFEHFSDRRVRPLVCDFASELGQLEHEINERNKRRPSPFELLLPSRVAASIHI